MSRPQTLSAPLTLRNGPRRSPPAALLERLWHTEPRLTAFALLLLALMVPTAIGLGVDERVLRGVGIWVKPLKFMAAAALLALTTVWFAKHLPAAVRRGRLFRALVWTLIASAGFEVGYITLQAALGQASHYNQSSAFHGLMYALMGFGAMVLTATQPWLAWLLWRHGDRTLAPAYRQAVLLGLSLSFALGAGAGALLSGLQPPAGAGLPIVGWSTSGGDLRVAHFIGIHAGQVLPPIGWALSVSSPRHAVAGVWAVTAGWTVLWGLALARALAGLPLIGL